jgi:hypothetical protein
LVQVDVQRTQAGLPDGIFAYQNPSF